MIKLIKIGNREIGPGKPCFIIAEAGVNHNGSLNRAKQLIDAAVKAEADVVKFQTFSADKIVTKKAKMADYQVKNTGKTESQYQMLKKLELNKNDFLILKKYADAKNIIFMSTPYDEDSVDLLEEIGVSAFKVSSADITNHPLLTYIAKKGLPVIFSRGMSNKQEIKEAIKVMQRTGNHKLILLHCHFNYPTDFKDVNLNMLATLRKEFNLITGYSDHTLGIEAPIAAAALRAQVIEKHFTLSRSLPGPDHKASLEPNELKTMVQSIRNIELALGSDKIQITSSEAPMRKVSRKSLVSAVKIPKGTVLAKKMIMIKRPGTGILPKDIKKIIGKISNTNIKADTLISWRQLR